MTGFELIVDGPPLRKNERHEIVVLRAKRQDSTMPGAKGRRATLKNSAAFDIYALRVMCAWRLAGHEPIRTGAWHVDCVAYFQRTRKLDVDVAFGDVDAAVSAALDALQLCKAIDDDVRFVTGTLAKHVDTSRPRLELTLRPAGPSPERRMLERIAKADHVEHPAVLREMAREALREQPRR